MAAERDLAVYPTVPDGDSAPIAWWDGPGDEFVALAANVGSPMVYLADTRLEQPALEQLEDRMRADGASVEELEGLRARRGERIALESAFVVGGVIHVWRVEADWWAQAVASGEIAGAADRLVRRADRQREEAEIEQLSVRTEALVAGLAEQRAFYSATNDEQRVAVASQYDEQLADLLGTAPGQIGRPAVPLARAIVRQATARAKSEVRPRLVSELYERRDEIASRVAGQLAGMPNKEQRRRVVRRAVEEELGFGAPVVVDAIVDGPIVDETGHDETVYDQGQR